MRSFTALATVVVCGTAVVVVAAPPASAATATTSSGSYTVQAACSAPAAGSRACFALKRVPSGNQPQAAAATPSGYGPADLSSAYNLPSTGGAGVTVAIVDAYDDPTAEADLAQYRSTYGLSACTTANGCFRKVGQTGSTTSLPATDTGWAGEIALDIDMVSAGCPACSILLVEAKSASNANLDVAENYAAAHADAVSNSFGGPESSSDTSDSAYTHAGVSIFASSGDQGYVVEFPAASPNVIAVGGTALSRSSTSRGWTEKVWNTGDSEGAGSGCSKYETKPSFQKDTGCTKRTVADVSAVADPATGVAVYDTTGGSGWGVYGGTSVASPLVASIFSRTGHTTATPAYPYASTGSFNDVTTGQTAASCTSYLCRAGSGYDGPTGVGTPNGTLLAGGTAPANGFSLSAAAASVAAGSKGTSTVTTTTTSGSAQSVSLTATGGPSGTTVAFSPASVTSGSSSTATVTVPAGAAAGSYSVTVTGTAASGTRTATLPLTVTSGTACATAQKLANPGFESGTASWSSSSGVISTDGAHSRTGSGYAWLDGYGSTHTDTLSQQVTLPVGCTTYTLSWWSQISTAETTTSSAYDTLTVAAGGTTLASYSNLDKSTGYVQHTVSLGAFKGTTVTVTFTGSEDGSEQTSFFLDDTAVTVS